MQNTNDDIMFVNQIAYFSFLSSFQLYQSLQSTHLQSSGLVILCVQCILLCILLGLLLFWDALALFIQWPILVGGLLYL